MRVRRTFAFLDLCGFTALSDSCGDDEAVRILVHLRRVLRAAAERHGVRVTKWLGDGAMLSGVDATSVVSCTFEVRDALDREGRLPLRAGISQGSVIMFEGDDYIGAAVNVAARLCALAPAAHVLLTAELSAAVPEDAGAPLPDVVRLAGVATPVAIVDAFPSRRARPASPARALDA